MNSYWAKYIYVPFFNLAAYIGRKYFWPHLKILFLTVVFPFELAAVNCLWLAEVFWWYFDEDVYTSFGEGFLLMSWFSHLHPHAYKRQRWRRNKKIHHPLRHSSPTPCHMVRGTSLGAKLHSGWANILKVAEMSLLWLKMRKRCPGNIICVFLMQKDGSNLYWASTELAACN